MFLNQVLGFGVYWRARPRSRPRNRRRTDSSPSRLLGGVGLGLGLMVLGLGLRGLDLGFEVWGLNLGFEVWGLGFEVWGLGLTLNPKASSRRFLTTGLWIRETVDSEGAGNPKP